MKKNSRVAVITGASKGIGKSIALKLLNEGNIVFNLDIDENTGNNLEKNNGIFFIKADVSDFESLMAAKNVIIKRYGSIDILIINAGISKTNTVDNISLEEWKKIIDINLSGSFYTIKAFYDEFSQKNCNEIVDNKKIVFISSGSAITGSGGGIHYAASKGAQFSMIRACARELGKYGVNVNGVAPRVIVTELFDDLYPTDELKHNLLSKIPIGRFGTSDDIAEITNFLCSESSSYIHGQIIIADGGRTYY